MVWFVNLDVLFESIGRITEFSNQNRLIKTNIVETQSKNQINHLFMCDRFNF